MFEVVLKKYSKFCLKILMKIVCRERDEFNTLFLQINEGSHVCLYRPTRFY